jgi:hypothetical protein
MQNCAVDVSNKVTLSFWYVELSKKYSYLDAPT